MNYLKKIGRRFEKCDNKAGFEQRLAEFENRLNTDRNFYQEIHQNLKLFDYLNKLYNQKLHVEDRTYFYNRMAFIRARLDDLKKINIQDNSFKMGKIKRQFYQKDNNFVPIHGKHSQYYNKGASCSPTVIDLGNQDLNKRTTSYAERNENSAQNEISKTGTSEKYNEKIERNPEMPNTSDFVEELPKTIPTGGYNLRNVPQRQNRNNMIVYDSRIADGVENQNFRKQKGQNEDNSEEGRQIIMNDTYKAYTNRKQNGSDYLEWSHFEDAQKQSELVQRQLIQQQQYHHHHQQQQQQQQQRKLEQQQLVQKQQQLGQQHRQFEERQLIQQQQQQQQQWALEQREFKKRQLIQQQQQQQQWALEQREFEERQLIKQQQLQQWPLEQRKFEERQLIQQQQQLQQWPLEQRKFEERQLIQQQQQLQQWPLEQRKFEERQLIQQQQLQQWPLEQRKQRELEQQQHLKELQQKQIDTNEELSQKQQIEAKEETEIVEMHHYFVDDKIKNYPNKYSLEYFELIFDKAKNFENYVNKFSGDDFMEYFILHENLMILIEIMDKIRCENDETLFSRKIDIVHLIKEIIENLDSRKTCD